MPARRLVVVALAVALVIPVAASAAMGSSGPVGTDTGSDYLAGYDQPTKLKQASIKRFVVPDVACDMAPSGIELGLGYEPVEGKREYAATVVVACVDGTPTYRTRALVDGVVETSDEVAAGDVIRAGLTLDAGTLTATLTNTSNPAGTVRVSRSVRSADGVTYGAFPVHEAGVRLPVPDFGKVTIKKATAGKSPERLNRVGDPGIRTSKPLAARAAMPPDDVSFRLRYVVHCCAP